MIIKNCINCNSSHLSFNEIKNVVKSGLTDLLLNTQNTEKLDQFTCQDCGFVMLFNPKITRV